LGYSGGKNKARISSLVRAGWTFDRLTPPFFSVGVFYIVSSNEKVNTIAWQESKSMDARCSKMDSVELA
jgi:hypothetical protein